jgi:hypothetical protein
MNENTPKPCECNHRHKEITKEQIQVISTILQIAVSLITLYFLTKKIL